MERLIDLPGCVNFRDLGGYPAGDGMRVRWRVLFRSDALHRLTPEGADRLIGELGVGAIVDLRSTGEVEAECRGLLRERSPRYHPLTSDAKLADQLTLADRYFLMAEHAKGPIARVVATLAESPTPAVYHCAAGKDRTGVISAILLGLLGVREEIIVADYAATQQNLQEIVDRLLRSEGYREVLDSLPADTMHAEPETMFSLLRQLRQRYGSIRGYARDIGLEDAAIDRLEARLLESSSA
jgi:protein-tyrosine phosphatase